MIYLNTVQDIRLLKIAEEGLMRTVGTHTYFNAEQCTWMGVFDDDVLLGVVVIHNYEASACVQMSIYSESPKWCTRKVLVTAFDYCFNTLDIKRVYTQVCAENAKALKMNKRLGFEQIAVLPESIVRLDGKVCDNHIFTMTREQCRFLNSKQKQCDRKVAQRSI